MTLLLVLAAALQGEAWAVTPAGATVGDTVWLARVVAAPAGWRARPGRLEPGAELEPLGEPVLERVPGGWRVRYALVAWAPGRLALRLPPLWLIGPGGRADSLPGGGAVLAVASVLPDTGRAAPRPALAPLRGSRRRPWAPAAAAALAVGALAAGWRWRRRAPREIPGPAAPRAAAPVPDARWLVAGEPRAVAARARALLRGALARAVPGAHEALDTAACVALATRAQPALPAQALSEMLSALDDAAFAETAAADVAALAGSARRLARELAP